MISTQSRQAGAIYRKRYPLHVVFPNFLVLGVLYIASQVCTMEETLWVFGAAQLFLYGTHLLHMRSAADYDILDALNVVNVGLFLHLGLGPFLLYYDLLDTRFDDMWSIANFPRALVMIHACIVMAQAGYYSDLFGHKSPPLFANLKISEPRLAGLTVLICSLPFVLQFVPDNFVKSGIIIMLMSQLTYLPVLLIVLCPRQSTYFLRITVIAGVVFALGYSLFWGITSKSGVAAPFCALLLLSHYFYKRWRPQYSVLALAGVVLLVTYLNYTRGSGYAANLSWDMLNPFSFKNIETYRDAGISALLTPVEGFLAVLTSVPDQIPYQYGQRLLEELIYPIFPRIFFDFKPEVYGSNIFWEYHRGFITAETQNWEAISLPGYFYLDFGFLGVLGGGFLFGVITRYIYRRLILQGISRGSVCLYGLVCVVNFLAARAFIWTTQTILIHFVAPFFVILLLRSKKREVGNFQRTQQRQF